MQKLQIGYVITIALVWFLNGYALLQHLAVFPEMDGFIAATLLVNMLTAPAVIWAAYMFGRIAEERLLRRRRHRAEMARS